MKTLESALENILDEILTGDGEDLDDISFDIVSSIVTSLAFSFEDPSVEMVKACLDGLNFDLNTVINLFSNEIL